MANDVIMIPLPDGAGKKIHKHLYQTDEYEKAIAADATVGSFTINANALTHTIVCFLPNWTNAVTGTLSITNSDSREIYSIAALAKNTVHVLAVVKPLVGTNTITITLSGVPGGAGGTTATSLYLTGAS